MEGEESPKLPLRVCSAESFYRGLCCPRHRVVSWILFEAGQCYFAFPGLIFSICKMGGSKSEYLPEFVENKMRVKYMQ